LTKILRHIMIQIPHPFSTAPCGRRGPSGPSFILLKVYHKATQDPCIASNCFSLPLLPEIDFLAYF